MDDVQSDINYALRHLLRPKVKWKDEAESKRAASVVAEHLDRCGYVVMRKPEKQLHGTPKSLCRDS